MFNRSTHTVEAIDPELWAAIRKENVRQEQHIELIASENYTSPAVMAAQGSQLTNKYAEGYPGKRYYGGCEYVDIAETLAIDRLKQLFGYPTIELAANVQPHSGAQANTAVFLALLNPGDTIMGLVAGRGRAPDARHGAQYLGQVVQGRELRPERARGGRLRRDGAAGAPAQAEADHRRCLGLFAALRLGALRQGGQGRRRLLHGRHGALRRPDRGRRLSEPDPARRCRHQHDAQDAARPARRPDPDEAEPGKADQQRGVPRHPGRSADARDRGQGGRVQGSAGAGVQDLPAAGDGPTRA